MSVQMRTIYRDHAFEEQAAQLEADVRKLDDVLQGVEWAVARAPEAFTRVTGNVYVVETYAMLAEDQYVFIFFTIDDENCCTLRWIVRGDVLVRDTTIAPVFP